jgi:hypothetical protein
MSDETQNPFAEFINGLNMEGIPEGSPARRDDEALMVFLKRLSDFVEDNSTSTPATKLFQGLDAGVLREYLSTTAHLMEGLNLWTAPSECTMAELFLRAAIVAMTVGKNTDGVTLDTVDIEGLEFGPDYELTIPYSELHVLVHHIVRHTFLHACMLVLQEAGKLSPTLRMTLAVMIAQFNGPDEPEQTSEESDE